LLYEADSLAILAVVCGYIVSAGFMSMTSPMRQSWAGDGQRPAGIYELGGPEVESFRGLIAAYSGFG